MSNKGARRNWVWWALLLLGLGLIFGSVWWTSGMQPGVASGEPDEAAHVVTGMMIRDYVWTGLPQHPLRYAEDYYEHYPKIGLGVWPPGFYLFHALWLPHYLGWPGSAELLSSALALLVAALVAGLVRAAGGRWLWAMAAAFCFAATPLARLYSVVVMTEFAVTAFSVLAVWALARWFDKPQRRWSLAFALLASAAILTKNSAYALALVPPLALVLLRDWRPLLRPSLWLAPVVVGVLCLPWTVLMFKHQLGGWQEESFSLGWVAKALPYYFGRLGEQASWGVLGLALAGVVTRVLGAARPAPLAAVLLAYTLAVPLFHSLVPAGLETRHLLPALPGVFVFAAWGAADLCVWARQRWPQLSPAAAVGTLAVLALVPYGVLLASRPVAKRTDASIVAAVGEMLQRAGTAAPVHALVVSDAMGEGAAIAALAWRDADRPSHYFPRSSKELADSQWSGRCYAPRFATSAALAEFARTAPYQFWVVDFAVADHYRRAHHELAAQAVEQFPEVFQAVWRSADGHVGLFAVRRPEPATAAIPASSVKE